MALLAGTTVFALATSKTAGPASTASQTAAGTPNPPRKINPDEMPPLIVGELLKAASRNPDSLVIERALANPARTYVCVAYRAQNGFGGMNREHAVFTKVGGDTSAGTWNKHCTKGAKDDVTNEVQTGTRLTM